MSTGECDTEKDSRAFEDNGNYKENKINFSKEVKQVIDKVSLLFCGSWTSLKIVIFKGFKI